MFFFFFSRTPSHAHVIGMFWQESTKRHCRTFGLPRIIHHPSDVVVRVGSPATLSCRAEGNPKPTIQWLRNGQPLDTDKMDAQSQPVVLPEGSLFFFSVIPGRKSQSHEAVYACVARNSAGVATSRNASLHIAALREEFRVQPSDVEVAVGEVAVMNCSPPVGHPEPNVTWRKDGILINSSNENYTELNGKLIIAPAQKNDSGVYSCIASNTVGVRESRAARLSILEDVSVQLGASAQFFCEADGDPMPSVEWSREKAPLPNGRYLINPDHSLQIHYVTAQDTGRYTCTAENKLGVSVASAQLLVEGKNASNQCRKHQTERLTQGAVCLTREPGERHSYEYRLQHVSSYVEGNTVHAPHFK
uniref:Roundabout, axon guidance receptor, homolog 4 (Drosophila) n=1 Tax=Sinocyclocheilus rhinocerous TaxID=307959 RepID=A0A673JHU5_9TELE